MRLPSGDWYALQVEKEQRWLPVLAPRLPLPIPAPVAKGEPGEGYPYAWSVYRWLDGEIASEPGIADLTEFATDAGGASSSRCAASTPPAGRGPAATTSSAAARSRPTRTRPLRSIDALGDEIPGDAALRVWEDAMAAGWDGDPVWFHGDVATGNLLLRDGRLAAVIDFGTSGVGDPACDVVIAWTLLSGASRDAFRATLGADRATWSRGRGWALWKALISLVGNLDEDDAAAAAYNRRTIDRVLADHARLARGLERGPGAAPR